MRGPLTAHWLAAALLTVVAPVAGCVENDQSIVITGMFAPDGSCEAPASGGKVLGRGLFDIGLASALNRGYILIPRILNLLPPSAGMMMGGMMGGQGTTPIEMNHVWLVGFEVDLLPDPQQPITMVLQPGVPGITKLAIPYAGGQLTAMGGTLTVPVEVFNSNAASMLLNSGAVRPGPSTLREPYQTVTVRIRARLTRSGSVLFSNWMEFPIEICAFCLAGKPGEPGVSGYNPATSSLFECPDATSLEEDVLGRLCLPQQDVSTPCCLKDRQVLCSTQIPHKKDSGGGM